MNLEEAVRSVAAVSMFYPRAELPEATIMAWANELLDFDAGDVLEGVKVTARTSHFAPTLAEIIDAAEEQRKAREELEYEAEVARRREEQRALPEVVYEGVKIEVASKVESLKRIRETMRRVGRPMSAR